MRLDKKGMTLVEVLVTMAVLSILLSVVYTIFNSSTERLLKEESRVEIQQSMKQATLLIEQDFRRANQSSIPELNENGCYYINLNAYCLDPDTGTLTKNDRAITTNIKTFMISEKDGQALIVLESTDDKYGQNVMVETKSTLRGKRDENKIPQTNP